MDKVALRFGCAKQSKNFERYLIYLYCAIYIYIYFLKFKTLCLFLEELSDDYAVVPGDSFPATGNHLVAISMNDIDEETSEDEQELLKRLVQTCMYKLKRSVNLKSNFS